MEVPALAALACIPSGGFPRIEVRLSPADMSICISPARSTLHFIPEARVDRRSVANPLPASSMDYIFYIGLRI